MIVVWLGVTVFIADSAFCDFGISLSYLLTIFSFYKGVLLIRRLFSLIFMITITNFCNRLMFLKLTWFGSKINILRAS